MIITPQCTETAYHVHRAAMLLLLLPMWVHSKERESATAVSFDCRAWTWKDEDRL